MVSRRKSSHKRSSHKKRKLNPYMKFVKKHRSQVVREYPNKKMTDVARYLGKMWNKLSDAEKAKYH